MKDISPKASEVTGIKILNNEMFVHDEKVVTYSARDGFLQFLFFLKRQQKPCILLGHNCLRFYLFFYVFYIFIDLLKE